mmetsp:Transcript_30931/g.68227  ORF Transcript_30931/g.68227 Transcript_30931/m.68227 type:complete len:256 (-) Transcript_30931:103-870(-)
MLLRVMDCDLQSKAQKRLAKCIGVFDLSDVSITSLRDPEFDMRHQRDVFNFFKSICCEINGSQYVVNAPWVIVKIFRVVASVLPQNFVNKLHLMDGDGGADPDFVETVGGKAQWQQLLTSRVGLVHGHTEQPTGRADIGPGQSFEKFVDVSAGHTVIWSFSIEAGYADSFLGKSDIAFTASLMQLPDGSEEAADSGVAGSQCDAVQVEQVIEAGGAEVTGRYHAEQPGCLVLCWSNEHSTVRSKSVRYKVEVSRA